MMERGSESFEAWCRSIGLTDDDLSWCEIDGYYRRPEVGLMWRGWKACEEQGQVVPRAIPNA